MLREIVITREGVSNVRFLQADEALPKGAMFLNDFIKELESDEDLLGVVPEGESRLSEEPAKTKKTPPGQEKKKDK